MTIDTGWFLVKLMLGVTIGAIHLFMRFVQGQSGNSMVEVLSSPIAVTSDALSVKLLHFSPRGMAGLTR